jgi:hypothetical protein
MPEALRKLDPRARAALIAVLAVAGYIAVKRMRASSSQIPAEAGATGANALGVLGGGGSVGGGDPSAVSPFGSPIVLTPADPNDPANSLALLGYASDGTPIYAYGTTTVTGAVGQTDGAAGVQPAAAPGNTLVTQTDAAQVQVARAPAAGTVVDTFSAPTSGAESTTPTIPIGVYNAHPDAFPADTQIAQPSDIPALQVGDAPPVHVVDVTDNTVTYLQLGRKLEINP